MHNKTKQRQTQNSHTQWEAHQTTDQQQQQNHCPRLDSYYNVVVVWWLYYIDTIKRDLIDTNAYKLQASFGEWVVVDGHGCNRALHVGVKARDNQDKIPTLYWLP